MVTDRHSEQMQAWHEFREALRDLGQADPTRALLYLRGATCTLRDWTASLRRDRPGPSDRKPRVEQ